MNKCIDCGKKLSTKYSKRCHFHANLKILAERNYIHSDETKIKISNNTKKAMLSQIIIDKISKSKIGKVPWNKNKEYSDNEKQKLNIDGLILGHGWNKGTKGVMKVNSTSFKKGMISLNRGKTKENRLYPKQCGFQKGHLPFGGAIKGRLKGQIPHNKGISVWLECKCQECGSSFKIRKCHSRRGRGKYCSRACYFKAKTIYKLSPTERFVHRFRQLEEYGKWRMDCLKRDWFKCQECSAKDNLQVHHIKSFTELVIEFLQKHNQFSPLEDAEILLRLATTYKPFWDINNGITLCELHHKSLSRSKI
jgi:hypothetical protein